MDAHITSTGAKFNRYRSQPPTWPSSRSVGAAKLVFELQPELAVRFGFEQLAELSAHARRVFERADGFAGFASRGAQDGVYGPGDVFAGDADAETVIVEGEGVFVERQQGCEQAR